MLHCQRRDSVYAFVVLAFGAILVVSPDDYTAALAHRVWLGLVAWCRLVVPSTFVVGILILICEGFSLVAGGDVVLIALLFLSGHF